MRRIYHWHRCYICPDCGISHTTSSGTGKRCPECAEKARIARRSGELRHIDYQIHRRKQRAKQILEELFR